LEEYAAVRIAVLGLQDGTVPAMFLELKLTLADRQLQAVDRSFHHIRIAITQLQLLLGQSGEVTTRHTSAAKIYRLKHTFHFEME
jgi:hypothetical protein